MLVINHASLLMIFRNPQRWNMILQDRRPCSLNEVMSPGLRSTGIDPWARFDLHDLYWNIMLGSLLPLQFNIFGMNLWGQAARTKGLMSSCICAGRPKVVHRTHKHCQLSNCVQNDPKSCNFMDWVYAVVSIILAATEYWERPTWFSEFRQEKILRKDLDLFKSSYFSRALKQ